jgi:hypothetical protein
VKPYVCAGLFASLSDVHHWGVPRSWSASSSPLVMSNRCMSEFPCRSTIFGLLSQHGHDEHRSRRQVVAHSAHGRYRPGSERVAGRCFHRAMTVISEHRRTVTNRPRNGMPCATRCATTATHPADELGRVGVGGGVVYEPPGRSGGKIPLSAPTALRSSATSGWRGGLRFPPEP